MQQYTTASIISFFRMVKVPVSDGGSQGKIQRLVSGVNNKPRQDDSDCRCYFKLQCYTGRGCRIDGRKYQERPGNGKNLDSKLNEENPCYNIKNQHPNFIKVKSYSEGDGSTHNQRYSHQILNSIRIAVNGHANQKDSTINP
ncbi:hypothetical protein [Thermoplasma acidophilum]|uniref:Uncharacterized protein n=1 Tax=Thermoplasma acidophilum (strain ATCC 25905 / DSM 1728 / JCM 9062 / NBRC 15155 / AMRC-C165) TaxID=273075 RepID=Q9HL10_THEAC|nr:hypothetical protein [Thermoplasma acidophilum]